MLTTYINSLILRVMGRGRGGGACLYAGTGTARWLFINLQDKYFNSALQSILVFKNSHSVFAFTVILSYPLFNFEPGLRSAQTLPDS